MADTMRVCNRVFYENELYHFGIKGQKWGVRRYQNADGTLTPRGQKRYDSDIAKNPLSKAEKKAGGRAVNADKWVTDDISRHKKLVESSNNLTNQMKSANNLRKTKAKPRLDMSNMTDQQLRDAINRRQLENQYNNLFNAPETSRGRERVANFLDTSGAVLGVTAAGLGVALSVRELRNK